MSFAKLLERNLIFFWRTHLAVLAAVAITVGVLTGALLVGDSVRGSLRDLFLSRIGKTDVAVVAGSFFRSELAVELGRELGDVEAVGIVAFEGMVTAEATGRSRAGVQVYGVADDFWRFHDARVLGPTGRSVLLTGSLASELATAGGDTVLLRVERPSDVARGSLHGSKEDVGRTIRLTVAEGLEASGLPEFSLYPQQGAVPAIFVPLARLQRDLGVADSVNTILLGSSEKSAIPTQEEVRAGLARSTRLEDLGVRVELLDGADALTVESDALLISEPLVDAVFETARSMQLETAQVLSYLANSMRIEDRETPYSLVAALDEASYEDLLGRAPMFDEGIVLNRWTGDDLDARAGDSLSMEFYLWRDEGRIETESATFIVEDIVDMTGLAADRDLAPSYPGISETENVSDWEPPFPVELSRVRDKDEAYWDAYRATPKAFLPLARGQGLWPVRQGRLTSIRLKAPAGTDAVSLESELARGLLERLDPLSLGFAIASVREQGLEASRGATDFGEYFVYFSYFLVVAALLLTGLFFKLGVEQRLREVGTLVSLGIPLSKVRRLFLSEGLTLSILGGLLGVVAAMVYAWIIMFGLRTWWVDAVGTQLLELHVTSLSLSIGVAAGVLSAGFAIYLTLRSLSRVTPRQLLTGIADSQVGSTTARSRRARALGIFGVSAALVLLGLTVAGMVSDTVGFFGAGNLLLVAALAFFWNWLASESRHAVAGSGATALATLGFRNATTRPTRSLVAVALIAFASFTVVAVEAFRKNDREQTLSRNSGNGGFALVGESLLPLHWDPNSRAGREGLNLPFEGDSDFIEITMEPFRLRSGDDASCLNLYRPQNPRILGVSSRFGEEGRFRFAASLARTDEERANPWLLLDRNAAKASASEAIPVIGDANSMAYVLHLGLGETFSLSRVGQTPLQLRLVATLRDSVFQGELLMAESDFLEHFPEVDGFRYFLVETPEAREDEVAEVLERRLMDYGIDLQPTSQKLASFHRVENTYLSTFQSLGGLGLVLGTLGLATILLRNALERRRELALLRAVGFKNVDFALLVLAENALLLFAGLFIGAVAAVVAIFPALLSRGGELGSGVLGMLLLAVVISGVLSSFLAVFATVRAPLLETLRSE